MNWDRIELHVENLVPGLVLGGIATAFTAMPVTITKLSDIQAGAVFVAVSYLLGTVGNVLARLLVDTVSKHTLRPLFIGLLARDKLSPQELLWKNLGRRYSAALDAGLSCGKPLIEAEVAKRRLTGRLLRSCLLPAWAALWIAFSASSSGTVVASLMFVAYVAVLVLYAYAEVVIFREGLRGERVRQNTP